MCVLFCSAPLRLMFGLVAVGMDCGHVYLVDLRLDDDVEEFDEWNPSHLEVVDPDDPNFAALRSRAREDGGHIAFELGGLSFLATSFSLCLLSELQIMILNIDDCIGKSIPYLSIKCKPYLSMKI